MTTATLTNRFTGRKTTVRIEPRGESGLMSAPLRRVNAALARICGENMPVGSSESFIAFDSRGYPAQMFDAAE